MEVIFVKNVSSCLFDLACALKLQIADNVSLVGGNRGEWQTTDVIKTEDSSDRVYLQVTNLFNSNHLIKSLEFRELVSVTLNPQSRNDP